MSNALWNNIDSFIYLTSSLLYFAFYRIYKSIIQQFETEIETDTPRGHLKTTLNYLYF